MTPEKSPRLGVSLVCREIGELSKWARAIEAAGLDMIGFGDSPSVYPETYVQGAIVAANTERVRFGPRVTTPVTRHPVVTASAMTALDQLSGGRAVLGIGVGDSAVHGIGHRKATLTELSEYVAALRSLFRTGSAEYCGKRVEFPYAARDIPIYLAASGPKGLQLAGEIADGVIVGGGISRELIEIARRQISLGAERSGRTLDDLDLWWLAGASIAGTREAAVEAIKTHLAAAANAIYRTGTLGKAVPKELEPGVRELVSRYDFNEHELADPGSGNVRLVEELGLTDFLARRFAFAGTPDQFADQILEAYRWGATGLWMTMPLPDKLGFLSSVRDDVRPRLQGRLDAD
jgi:5,10-methylenetetrahydromethanopterin reductase